MFLQLYILFLKFYFIFKLYNIVLVLPNIEMNPPLCYVFKGFHNWESIFMHIISFKFTLFIYLESMHTKSLQSCLTL